VLVAGVLPLRSISPRRGIPPRSAGPSRMRCVGQVRRPAARPPEPPLRRCTDSGRRRTNPIHGRCRRGRRCRDGGSRLAPRTRRGAARAAARAGEPTATETLRTDLPIRSSGASRNQQRRTARGGVEGRPIAAVGSTTGVQAGAVCRRCSCEGNGTAGGSAPSILEEQTASCPETSRHGPQPAQPGTRAAADHAAEGSDGSRQRPRAEGSRARWPWEPRQRVPHENARRGRPRRRKTAGDSSPCRPPEPTTRSGFDGALAGRPIGFPPPTRAGRRPRNTSARPAPGFPRAGPIGAPGRELELHRRRNSPRIANADPSVNHPVAPSNPRRRRPRRRLPGLPGPARGPSAAPRPDPPTTSRAGPGRRAPGGA